MAHFIDTVVLDEVGTGAERRVVGFEALVSPPGDPSDQPDPRLVLDALGGATANTAIEERDQLVRLLTFVIVNPPLIRRPDREFREPEVPFFSAELIGWVERAIDSPLIVVETSPVSKRSLTALAAMGTTTTLYFFGIVPVLVVVGAAVGVVFIRGIRGLADALWEGARPEVVDFGRDAAKTYLDVIRERLEISRADDE
jgi:hypothetical protein